VEACNHHGVPSTNSTIGHDLRVWVESRVFPVIRTDDDLSAALGLHFLRHRLEIRCIRSTGNRVEQQRVLRIFGQQQCEVPMKRHIVDKTNGGRPRII